MRKVIGLDIGGTNTRAALIDEELRIEKTVIRPTVSGDLPSFLESIASAVADLSPEQEGVCSLAGGVPGRVRQDGYVYALPNVHISSIPLSSFLSERFHLPVSIINDAEVAALAEANVGPFSKAKSLFFVTVSTGLGGALTVDGKIRSSSYEIGHTLFPYQGKTYELEHLASGSGIVRLCSLNGLEVSSAAEFFSLVKGNNPLAKKVYEDWMGLLVKFFTMVQDLFSPEIVAMTGGVMKSQEVFFSDLRSRLPYVNLHPCFHGQFAGLLGAGVLAFQTLD